MKFTSTFLVALGLLALASPLHSQTLQQEANTAMASADWYERTITTGIIIKSFRFDDLFDSRQVVHVIEIDMSENVAFTFPYLTGGATNTVSNHAAGVTNAAAAINGNFGYSGGSVQYLKVANTLINTTLDNTIDDRGGVTIDSSGDLHARYREDVSGWASLADPDIMATNVPIVRNGAQFPFGTESFYTVDRHPRTLVGTTADGKALFVVVDGRSTIADGMTFEETAATLMALGATNAVNMDGGGSSTMWDRELTGNGVSNVPSDGSQRSVVNAIAVTSPNAAPTPASYDSQLAGTSSNSSPHAPILETVLSGDTADITIQFVNTGSTTWTPSTVFLVTSETFEHASSIEHSSWISSSRPTALDTASVATGATGSFTFTVQAPTVTTATTVEESYVLVDGTGTAFGPHQNRLYLTVLPPADETDIVVESRVSAGAGGGVTPSPNYVETGAFANTSSKSTVTTPPVVGAGGRYNTTIGSTATFRPDITIAGTYNVYITMGTGTNNNAIASYVIDNAGPDITGSVNLVYTDSNLVNKWKLLESNVEFNAGTSEGITLTNTNGNAGSGARFVSDAVRFELVAASVEDWVQY